MPKKLYLIDASSYFFRAYYAIRHLSNAEGIPTNATLGFTTMLLKVLNEHRPDYVAVVYDSKGPGFRKEMYAEYKANRSETPADLVAQIPYIKEIVQAYRLPSWEVSGFEADDIIATLVKRFADQVDEVTIVSGDKDLMQLVTERVTVLDTMKDKRFGSAEVAEKFGASPAQLLDLFSLAGDTSDNIPGVPGIGLKTAAALIKQFETLDRLLESADQVPGKSTAQKLKEHRQKALLSRDLLRLHEAVPLECDLAALMQKDPDYEALQNLFRKLEFNKLIKDLETAGKAPTAKAEDAPPSAVASSENAADPVRRDQYRLLTHLPDLQSFLNEVREKNLPLSLDLETTSLNPMSAEIVGIALCARLGQSVYIPIAHRQVEPGVVQPDLTKVLDILRPFAEDPKIGKRGQNLKYDDVILRRHGVTIQNIAFDTMLASYLLTADERSGHDLDRLSLRYLQHTNISYDEVTKNSPTQSFADVPLNEALQYAGEDADVVLHLENILRPRLTAEGLDPLFYELELPLSSVLAEMEVTGVAIDQSKLKELSESFEVELQSIRKKVYEMAGEEFLISSPKQLQKILFEKLNLPRGRKTKTGYSTDTEVLIDLARHHDMPNYLLRHRVLSKLKGTYLDALPLLVDPKTGRLHTRFNQAVAATGRLSSSDPNLQNIPIRGAEGQLIRAAFVPEKGFHLVGADYSQIELRMFAHFSEDPLLMQAYKEDLDIHSLTAQAIFSVTEKEITDEMRRRAKVINFGILYGMSDFRLAKELGISNHEGTEFIQRYFARYPGVKNFIDSTIAKAHETGFVSTYLGRKRRFSDLRSSNYLLRKAAERAACSTAIQGSAADLIKTAMVRLHRKLKEQGFKARMILQVHDELLFECPPDELEKLKALVTKEMQDVWALKVPILIDYQIGQNWLEVH